MIKFLCCVPGPHGSEEAPVRIVDAPDGYFIKKDLKTVAEIMTNPANYPKWTHALLKYGGDVVDGTKTDGDSVTFRIAWGANDPEAKGLASLVTVTKFEDPGKLVLELDAYMFDESVPSDEVASVFAGGGDGRTERQSQHACNHLSRRVLDAEAIEEADHICGREGLEHLDKCDGQIEVGVLP